MNNQKQVIFWSAISGALRSVIGLPFEHPLDALKTNMQSNNLSATENIRRIIKTKGYIGFYNGFTINCIRVASRQAYRWPLTIFINGQAQKLLKPMVTNYMSGAAFLTALIVSTLEVGIMCPFQKIKVWLMTSPSSKRFRDYWYELHFRFLYDGFFSVFLRQLASWCSFLVAQQQLKQLMYMYTGKNRLTQPLSILELLTVSSGVAIINTACIMPFDFMKTNFQKYNSSGIGISELVCTVYKKHGFFAFYTGWQCRLIQYTINSIFTVSLYEYFMRKYQSFSL